MMRMEAARPNHGRPARFEVQFSRNYLFRLHGPDAVQAWWNTEVRPVALNMTGERAVVKDFSVFAETEQEAILVAMMFRAHIHGVLDWETIKWVSLPKPSTHPEL